MPSHAAHVRFLDELPKPPSNRSRTGRAYPKVGRLKSTDVSNKLIARSPKLDFVLELPQTNEDESLVEAIEAVFKVSTEAVYEGDVLSASEDMRRERREVSLGLGSRTRGSDAPLSCSTPALNKLAAAYAYEKRPALLKPPLLSSYLRSGSSTSCEDLSSEGSLGSSRPPSIFA